MCPGYRQKEKGKTHAAVVTVAHGMAALETVKVRTLAESETTCKIVPYFLPRVIWGGQMQ